MAVLAALNFTYEETPVPRGLLSTQDCNDAIEDRYGEEDESDKWFVCVFHVYSSSIGCIFWLTHV